MLTAGRRLVGPADLSHCRPAAARWPAAALLILVLAGVLLAPALVTLANLVLLAMATTVLLAARGRLAPELGRALLACGAIAALGLLGSHGRDPYLVAKDAWYVLNPAILIATGWVLARCSADAAPGLRALVLAGALIGALHGTWFLLLPGLLDLPAARIRSISGTGFYATALAVLVLLAHLGAWGARLRLPAWLAWPCLLLCAASVALSFSRTLWLALAAGGLVLAGLLQRHAGRRVAGAAAAALAAVLVLQATVDTDSLQARQSFVGKLARSLQELQPTERMTVAEINENFRGYETARALRTWADGHAGQWVFGHGFGTEVDLGLYQQLTPNPREAMRWIPILHNGYAYLLVKTGVLGLLAYVGLIAHLVQVGQRHARGSDAARAQLGRLLVACAVVLLLTTWVVAGAFSKFDLFAFLLGIGFLLGRLAPGVRATGP